MAMLSLTNRCSTILVVKTIDTIFRFISTQFTWTMTEYHPASQWFPLLSNFYSRSSWGLSLAETPLLRRFYKLFPSSR